jgi:hypothetical protein
MKFLYTFLFIFIQSFIFTQRWAEIKTDGNSNFYDIQKAYYEDYNSTVDPNYYGVKQFKRWEYFMEPRVYPSGEIKDFFKWAYDHKEKNTNRNSRNATWQPMGPSYWSTLTNEKSPGNGRVSSIAVDPSNPLIIYIAASGGGIWKTTDGGVNWVPLTDDLPTLKTSDIIIDKNNPNVLFLVTGDNDSYNNSLGIYKTIDGGVTWTVSLSFNSDKVVGSLMMDPNNSNLIYCATSNGIYRSINGGNQWLKLNSTNLYNIKLQPNNPGVVYATDGTRSNIVFLKSVDSGVVFTPITIPISDARRIEIEVSDISPNYVYLLAASINNGFGGLFLSKDYGVTWQTMSTTPNIIGSSTVGSGTGALGAYALALEVNPTNPAEVIIGGVNVWKSNDTGTTWINLTYPNPPSVSSTSRFTHPDIHFLNYFGSKLFCASDGGVFTSNDLGNS